MYMMYVNISFKNYKYLNQFKFLHINKIKLIYKSLKKIVIYANFYNSSEYNIK